MDLKTTLKLSWKEYVVIVHISFNYTEQSIEFYLQTTLLSTPPWTITNFYPSIVYIFTTIKMKIFCLQCDSNSTTEHCFTVKKKQKWWKFKFESNFRYQSISGAFLFDIAITLSLLAIYTKNVVILTSWKSWMGHMSMTPYTTFFFNDFHHIRYGIRKTNIMMWMMCSPSRTWSSN